MSARDGTSSNNASHLDDIAVVGMSGRFPGANSVQELWNLLMENRAMHREIPSDRFDIQTHVDETGQTKNAASTRYGAFIDQPGLFDNELFNISPREAAKLDPMHRNMLMTAYEALEMAGYQKGRTASSDGARIGTFVGCSSDDWRTANISQDIDALFVPSGSRSFGPGRLNYFFKWEGVSYVCDTACSSSTAAIQLAVNSLKLGDCDTAVVGASLIATNPDIFTGHSAGGFLSPTGGCKTFLDNADGYCRADGVSCIVLKRLQAAEADNDNILGVIRGCGTRHSAYAASLTRPFAPTQAQLSRDVLAKAGMSPSDVDYIEMHGTGTTAGDSEESQSVAEVFLEGKQKDRQSPLYVGTLKPNIGHSEAASGMSSIIKALLMLQHQTVPPHLINGQPFNPNLPEGFTDLIPQTSQPLGAGRDADGKGVIMVSNFSASGGNTSVLLEGHKRRHVAKTPDPRDCHVVAVSAASQKSLTGNIKNLFSWVEEHPDASLADLAYTTTARRVHNRMRVAFAAESMKDLTVQLREAVRHPPTMEKKPKAKKIVLAFSGQGVAYEGMGQDLYASSKVFRTAIEECDAACQENGFASILHCFDALVSKSPAEISSIVTDQMYLIALEIGLHRFWDSCGLRPDMIIGHSLGEFAALHAAGVLSLKDAMFLVGKRAELLATMLSSEDHGMLAVPCSRKVCDELLEQSHLSGCDVACENAPTLMVVSGPLNELETLKAGAQHREIKATMLDVPFAFHSRQMDDVLAAFEPVASSIPLEKPKIAYASSCKGSVVKAGDALEPNYLATMTRQPVKFYQAAKAGVDFFDEEAIWIELGPARSCIAMAKAGTLCSAANSTPSLSKQESPWKSISKSLAKLYEAEISLNWPGFHKEFEKDHLTLIPDLPTYSFDTKNFWTQYEGDWLLHKNRMLSPSAASKSPVDSGIGTPESDKAQTKETPVDAIADSPPSTDEKADESLLRKIIADELEVKVSDVTRGAEFADLGLNSIIGMGIVGILRKKGFGAVPKDVFTKCTTLEEALGYLGIEKDGNSTS